MELDPLKNRPKTVVGLLELSVGPGQGDLQGSDDKILQAGVDYLHRLGGGTLNVLPGTYTMHNALYLQPTVKVRGTDDAPVFMGLETQFCCTADPSGWDPINGKSPVHLAAELHQQAMIKALKTTKTSLIYAD